MKVNYVTTNKMKFEIAKAYFEKIDGDYELVECAIETPEVQDVSVEEIARQSALWAARKTGKPCIKLDVGCFIPILNGFPGPFVKYINDWLTQEDYLALLRDKSDRKAYFEGSLAIAYPDGETKVFSQKVFGSIASISDPSASRWPMDALFIPDGYPYTLGKMTDDEQVRFWGDGNWPALVEYLEYSS